MLSEMWDISNGRRFLDKRNYKVNLNTEAKRKLKSNRSTPWGHPGQPTVSVLVLNWNGMSIQFDGIPILKMCLDSFCSTEYYPINIIMVDAESSDESVKHVKQNFKNVDIISSKNKGWAYNNNVGIKYILEEYPDSDYIVIVSNDIISRDNKWLQKAIQSIPNDPDVGIIGCKLVAPNGYSRYTPLTLSKYGGISVYLQKANGYLRRNEYVIGAFMIVRTSLFRKIGFLDESYKMMGSEDSDFAERAFEAGFKSYHLNGISIVHLGSASTLSLSKELPNRWKVEDIKMNMDSNNLLFLLRWYKLLSLIYVSFILFRCFFEMRPRIVLANDKYHNLNRFFTSLFQALRALHHTEIPVAQDY